MTDPAPNRPTTLAQVAAGLGATSLFFGLFGCCCGVLPLIGVPVGIVAVVLGLLEHAKVRRGEVTSASGMWALIGVGTGALGALGGLIFLGIMGLGVVSEGGVIDKFKEGFGSP
ncbi:MAG: hypothetical protein KC502_17305 [Myxococcales bacterium]|nr:hypothetical protein [Myxococcales bacterium]